MTQGAADEPVTVAIVYSQPELATLLALFENAGIPVLALGAGHLSVEWYLAVALGGVRLRVHREDAAEACALLSGAAPVSRKRGVFCDNRLIDALLMLGLFLFGLFLPPARIPAVYCAPAAVAQRRN